MNEGAASSSEAAVLRLAIRYDEDARAYRDVWGPMLLPAGRRLLQEFAGLSVQSALDLGAGVGALTRELAQAFPQATVLGCDRSPGMIALGSGETSLAVMDARRLGLASCSLDLVVSTFMLFILERPADALDEVHRVLRREGRFGTSTWKSNLESPAIEAWNEALDEVAPAEAPSRTSSHDEQTDTPEKVAELLRAAGFASIRAWSEDLIHEIGPEDLVALRTGMGASRRRLARLEPEERMSFLLRVRRRFDVLGPGAFTARGKVVYATARRGR